MLTYLKNRIGGMFMFKALESLPIIVLFFLLTLLILIFIEIGFHFGIRTRSKRDADAPNYMGTIVTGLFGMLAFLLAFTFNMAATQYEKRKLNVVIEANDIGTAYLRADLIDEQYGNEIKHLLRKYVDLRLDIVEHKIDLETGLNESGKIHSLIWQQASSFASSNPSINASLLVQSINEVIDQHAVRLNDALYNRIPDSVWLALLLITLFTMMAMGTQMGLTGKRRLVAIIPLSISFAILVTLIIDLNRPLHGLIQVSQKSIINLKSNIN
jgi:hypothetical protein